MTRAEFDFLEAIDHMKRTIDAALCTGRLHTKATALRLEKRGLVESIVCVRVDGDGWTIEPERHGHGWVMTDAGTAALARARTHLGANGYPVSS